MKSSDINYVFGEPHARVCLAHNGCWRRRLSTLKGTWMQLTPSMHEEASECRLPLAACMYWCLLTLWLRHSAIGSRAPVVSLNGVQVLEPLVAWV